MTETQLPLFPYLEHQTADRPRDFIPVYEPWLGDLEEAYVLDAVRSGWISSLGKYVTQFEEAFAAFCGTEHGVSVSSGTTALHLAAHALGIGPGDEVIVPSLTFIASGSSITHTGATPRFADVDPVTWTIDVGDMASLITPRTKAIMPVHLYGHPAPMDEINLVAEEHGLAVIEDAAESHGAKINDRRTGSLGHIGAFSFFPNKVITTGEGGMLTTNDAALAARCRLLRDHAMPPERRYWHDEVGFNYRLTNLQAAVGIAQMTRIDEFVRRKREIAMQYHDQLSGVDGVTLPAEREGCTSIFWLYSILVESPYACSRDELIESLRERGIDSRPFFHPLDTLPPYHSETPRPTALRLSESGLNLPSSPRLTDEQITYVCDAIRELAGKKPA
jgi:perosamine synthetase